MDKLEIDNHEFIIFTENRAKIVFCTSKNKFNFSKKSDEYKENLKLLCKYFKINDIGFMNQIRSDDVLEYHNDGIFSNNNIIRKGDAIITNKSKIGVGIFTADCVPILIYDPITKSIAAVHSGWEGTVKNVLSKTISLLRKKYNCNSKNLKVYIGPHNMQCCYEFSFEDVNKYFKDYILRDNDIYTNGKLNLEKCIEMQLIDNEINKKNIYKTNICTYCNHDYILYSHRKKDMGRMFSFIFME